MQVEIDIEFDQLLRIIRTLPSGQLKLLKSEIERERNLSKQKVDLETLLMNGPIATKSKWQLLKNRKAINQWRTK